MPKQTSAVIAAVRLAAMVLLFPNQVLDASASLAHPVSETRPIVKAALCYDSGWRHIYAYDSSVPGLRPSCRDTLPCDCPVYVVPAYDPSAAIYHCDGDLRVYLSVVQLVAPAGAPFR